MIKLEKHALTCTCQDCADMFPTDRFEPTWSVPRPLSDADVADGGGDVRPVHGHLPIGHARPALGFKLWVDSNDRLAVEWPGFPGSFGSRVEVASRGGTLTITGTSDPVLRALADPIPLRRRAAARFHDRCLYEFGIGGREVTDYITCPTHEVGLPALTCSHVATDSPEELARSLVVVYGVDGDFPDAFCPGCFQRFAAGELEVTGTLCSRCLAPRLRHIPIEAATWYGAPPDSPPLA